MFRNLNLQGKLLLLVMLLLFLSGAVFGIGVYSLRSVRSSVQAMDAKGLEPVITISSIKYHFIMVRAKLVSLITAHDKAQQDSLLADIKKETSLLDEAIDKAIALESQTEARAKLTEYKEKWVQFRSTRDNELLPAFFSGNILKAQELGMGIQLERAKLMAETHDSIEQEAIAQTKQYTQVCFETIANSIKAQVAVLLISVILSLFFGFIIARAIAKPLTLAAKNMEQISKTSLEALSQALLRIADGDLSFEFVLPKIERMNRNRKDEVGRMLLSLDQMSDTLENKCAGGLSEMLQRLNEAFLKVDDSVASVNTGARQIAQASQALSDGASQQAASIEEIMSSMSEIDQQVRSSADGAQEANTLAQASAGDAEIGTALMAELTNAMRDIHDSSEKIRKIIKVIDEIAFQTNLLALNAAVEAARAGSHGKGFAVVAEEVRNLAARSAKAAKETESLIETAGDRVNNGSKLAQQTADALQAIASGAMKTSSLVSEIAASSREGAEGIAQINLGINQVSGVVQQNSASAEECAAASTTLNGQADELREQVTFFKLRASYAYPNANSGSHSGTRNRIQKSLPHAANVASASYKDGVQQGYSRGAMVKPDEVINLDDPDLGDF